METDIRSALFGRLAVETGLVTREQLRECLAFQRHYERKLHAQGTAPGRLPRLGEILVQRGYLTLAQVRAVLEKQRREPAEPPPDPVEEAIRKRARKVTSVIEKTPHYVYKHFVILERLGADANGYTYKARHIQSGCLVMLRILSGETMTFDAEYVHDFEKRIVNACALRHDAIQELFRAGRHEGRDYYAGVFFEGRSLRAVLEEEERLTPLDATRMAIRVAEALEYAHAAGVVHGEISPETIWLDDTGQAKVTGFGVARNVVGNLKLLALRAKEQPYYIAPEQALEFGGACDARTDLYGLGATLYHALSGMPPFRGDSLEEVFLEIATGIAVDQSMAQADVPEDLSAVVMRLLDPDPRGRFASAGELLSILRPILHRLETKRRRRSRRGVRVAPYTPRAEKGESDSATEDPEAANPGGESSSTHEGEGDDEPLSPMRRHAADPTAAEGLAMRRYRSWEALVVFALVGLIAAAMTLRPWRAALAAGPEVASTTAGVGLADAATGPTTAVAPAP